MPPCTGSIPKAVLPRSFDYGGANYIIEKDLELWRQEAEAYEVPGYMGNLVRTLFRQMIAEEGRDKDFTRIFMLMERMAGVEMSRPTARVGRSRRWLLLL